MLDNIIDKNIIFLKNHGVKMESSDDKAVYKYGLKILYYYIIDLVVVFSLAYIFGRLYETMMMTFIFGLLQIFGGGYHAKTPLKCLLFMITGAFAGNILINIISNYKIFMLISATILSFGICILAPIANKNRPVNKKVYKRSKIIARIIILSNLYMFVLLLGINKNIEATIIVAILYLYAVSLTAAKTVKKTIIGKKYEC